MLLSGDVSREYVRKHGQKKVNRLLPKHFGKFASLFGHLFGVFFASSCSTTGLMMKMQVFQGARLVFHRGLRSTPPPTPQPLPVSAESGGQQDRIICEIHRCNFTVSKLNCLLIQIRSMNITNRIRTKSQTWAEPKPKP